MDTRNPLQRQMDVEQDRARRDADARWDTEDGANAIRLDERRLKELQKAKKRGETTHPIYGNIDQAIKETEESLEYNRKPDYMKGRSGPIREYARAVADIAGMWRTLRSLERGTPEYARAWEALNKAYKLADDYYSRIPPKVAIELPYDHRSIGKGI